MVVVFADSVKKQAIEYNVELFCIIDIGPNPGLPSQMEILEFLNKKQKRGGMGTPKTTLNIKSQ